MASSDWMCAYANASADEMESLAQDVFAQQRQAMVEQQIRARGISDPRVLNALLKVPRHEFVPVSLRPEAYTDHPVAIGSGQTISQPYIVAYMLQAAAVQASDLVLEIGTGSGYATALLAELAHGVVSIERFSELAHSAAELLNKLGYTTVEIEVGDGTLGFPQRAPYDLIFVSAAAPYFPPALLEQLGIAGRMIIPVGDATNQELQLVTHTPGGDVVRRLEGCRFVPLIGEEGFRTSFD
jgi:protein-L-isoaspartate(D-aspartate) O-methyltransferase